MCNLLSWIDVITTLPLNVIYKFRKGIQKFFEFFLIQEHTHKLCAVGNEQVKSEWFLFNVKRTIISYIMARTIKLHLMSAFYYRPAVGRYFIFYILCLSYWIIETTCRSIRTLYTDSKYLMLLFSKANANFIVFVLNWSVIEPTIYLPQSKRAF
jgi:hypothetical protein